MPHKKCCLSKRHKKSVMMRHKKAVYRKLGELEFKVCFTKFTTTTDLTQHKSSWWLCRSCSVQFPSTLKLQNHICPKKDFEELAEKRKPNDEHAVSVNCPARQRMIVKNR